MRNDLDGPNFAWRGLRPNAAYFIICMVMLVILFCQMGAA